MIPKREIYSNEAAMEPLMPTDASGRLRESASRLLVESAKLAGTLHPTTRAGVAQLVVNMNSYYSNLIEGHHTHPADIERALKNDYSTEPAKRALQLESAAHVNVELLMTQLLQQPNVDVCADSFLQTLHREFYERMPDEFRILPSGKIIEPGGFRKGEVEVGAHLAPTFGSLSRFMSRFASAYDLKNLDPLDRVIAAAASHHRFAWIHPFQDGNGRVARLFTHAYLARAGVETAGLWALSRGFARRRDDYRAMLANADSERQGSLDGQGNLSNKGLIMFCEFFLGRALDQVSFMSKTLDLDAMQDRIMRFAERWSTLHDAPVELGPLMREAFLRGSLPRSEAARILNKPERTARRYVTDFIEQGLLCSDSVGGPLSISFSSKTVGYFFPRLYPEGVEI